MGYVAFWRGFAQPARYAALLAGAVPVLAFPKPNLEFIAWFGLIPGLLLLRAAPSGREAAMRGWWLGAGYLLAALYWLTPNLGPGLLLVVIVLGVPWSGVGYAAWRLLARQATHSARPAATRQLVTAAAGRADRSITTPGVTTARGGLGPDGPPDGPSGPEAAEAAEPAEPAERAEAAKPARTAQGRRSLTPLPVVRAVNAVPGPSTRQALAALVVLPSAWVVIDWIRSWQGIGGPWAVFGASQWQHPVVLALAAVGGIWLISFVLVLSNTGLVVALTAASKLGQVLGLACAGLAVAAAPAAFSLTAAEFGAPATGHVRLALVQPGLEGGPAARLAAETRLTDQLASTGPRRADVVVWGESSVGYDLRADPGLLARLARLSDRAGAPLLVSQDAVSPTGAKSKVAVLIDRRGIEGEYVKTRLVPFGEYIPFRPVLGWLSDISRAAPQNMIAGNGAHVLRAELPGGRSLTFGALICFESSFPDMSSVEVSQGAQVLIYQTSDSTFQGSWALGQHASLAAIRAAETGRPAVQAALTGDSAAFDSRGRVLAWMGGAERGVLRVTLALPPASAQTPFERYGDYVPWFAIAVVVTSIAWATDGLGIARRLRRG